MCVRFRREGICVRWEMCIKWEDVCARREMYVWGKKGMCDGRRYVWKEKDEIHLLIRLIREIIEGLAVAGVADCDALSCQLYIYVDSEIKWDPHLIDCVYAREHVFYVNIHTVLFRIKRKGLFFYYSGCFYFLLIVSAIKLLLDSDVYKLSIIFLSGKFSM